MTDKPLRLGVKQCMQHISLKFAIFKYGMFFLVYSGNQ